MTAPTRLLLTLLATIVPSAATAQTAIAPAPPAPAFPGQWAPPPIEWKYPVWPNGCTRFDPEERLACYAFVASDFGRLSRYADANRALASATADQARVELSAGAFQMILDGIDLSRVKRFKRFSPAGS